MAALRPSTIAKKVNSTRPSFSYELTSTGYVLKGEEECFTSDLKEKNAEDKNPESGILRGSDEKKTPAPVIIGPCVLSDSSIIEGIKLKTQEFMNKWTGESCGNLAYHIRDLNLEEKDDRINAVAEVVLRNTVKDPVLIHLISKEVQRISFKSVNTLKKFVQKLLDNCEESFFSGNVRSEVSTERSFLERNSSAVKRGSETVPLEEQLEQLNLDAAGDRKSMLGYARLFGELYICELFQPSYIVTSLEIFFSTEDKELLERICELLTTVAKKLNGQLKNIEQRNAAMLKRNKTPNWPLVPGFMDKLLARLLELSANTGLPPELRLTLLSLHDIGTNNGWKPRLAPVSAHSQSQTFLPPSERPDNTELPKVELHRTENPWKRYFVTNPVGEDQIKEGITRKTRGVMNKLTELNFEKLAGHILQLNLDNNGERVAIVIRCVVQQAIDIDEPRLTEACVKMVHAICQHSRRISLLFRKAMLDLCQNEFLDGRYLDDVADVLHDKQAKELDKDKRVEIEKELKDKDTRRRQRRFGITRIMTELYKVQLLSPSIMESCVIESLTTGGDEDLECVCIILTAIGQSLDERIREAEVKNSATVSEKRRPLWIPKSGGVSRMLETLKGLSECNPSSIPPRLRFALLDLYDLGNRGWIPALDPSIYGRLQLEEERRAALQEKLFQELENERVAALQEKLFPELEEPVIESKHPLKVSDGKPEPVEALTKPQNDKTATQLLAVNNEPLDPCVSEVPKILGELEEASTDKPTEMAQSKKKKKKKKKKSKHITPIEDQLETGAEVNEESTRLSASAARVGKLPASPETYQDKPIMGPGGDAGEKGKPKTLPPRFSRFTTGKSNASTSD